MKLNLKGIFYMSEKKARGSVDLLNGPILKGLILFMIPIVISSAFQQLYNAVDTAIVGNVLGENSLAAIGACASVFEMMVGFCTSLGNGFAMVAARSFGSGDEDKMKRSVAGSIVIGLITCAVLTILSMLFLRPLLQLINTPASILDESYAYIRVIGMWLIVMFIYNMCSGMLRSIGNSLMPLVFLIISSILNIFLDLLLIKTFNMGVVGAAVATVIAQGVSAVLCIIYILRETKVLIPSRKHFNVGADLYKDLAGQGYSMAFMGSIVSIGSITLQSGINSLGEMIIAGHVAARKIYMLFNLPFISMGLAVSTFISQNKGANKGKRILKAMKLAYIYDIIGAAAVTAILLLFGREFIHLITGSTNDVILSNGSRYLYLVGPFYAVLGVLMQTRFALQGLGSKLIPLISSVIELVGKIIFTILLIPKFGYNAVIFCEPVIWCFMTAQLLYAFNTNKYIREVRAEA